MTSIRNCCTPDSDEMAPFHSRLMSPRSPTIARPLMGRSSAGGKVCATCRGIFVAVKEGHPGLSPLVTRKIRCPNFVDGQTSLSVPTAAFMRNSNFRIVPLPTEVAEAARQAAKNGARDHRVMTADSAASYPCRHCLHFAKPGESVILFTYASIPHGHLYSESGPIFVHAEPCECYSATEEYPAEFQNEVASFERTM